MEKQNYTKLGISLLISFITMYAIMFLNVADVSHIYLSLTRLYMALLMVAPMAIIMLVCMRNMYKSKIKNRCIAGISVFVFVTALYLLRTQTFIDDKQYMRGMISHHSSAILTSSNASIKDGETKELSLKIIEVQKREIEQMQDILERMDIN